jgi:hypothetical protein
MAHLMKMNKTADPFDIGFNGPFGIAAGVHLLGNGLKKKGLCHISTSIMLYINTVIDLIPAKSKATENFWLFPDPYPPATPKKRPHSGIGKANVLQKPKQGSLPA